jgi:hypothetical protein
MRSSCVNCREQHNRPPGLRQTGPNRPEPPLTDYPPHGIDKRGGKTYPAMMLLTSDSRTRDGAGCRATNAAASKRYRYETHLHTAEASRCGRSPGAEMARHFHALGYAGIFVTDHFFNGNAAVPDDLPWRERVEQFCLGYEAAAREGCRLGLDVFLGWEYSHGWAHLLTYGLGKEWLLAHPDLLDWNILDYLDRVHADGGVVVHAHPFREGVEPVTLFPARVDAIEVANAGRDADCNRHARDFALSFGLPQTAGSDIHSTRQTRVCGILCSRRLVGGGDYLAALRTGEAVGFDTNLTVETAAAGSPATGAGPRAGRNTHNL